MPTKKRGRPKKVVPVEKPAEQLESYCHISLTLGDKTIEGSGETMLEALKALPTQVKIITKGVLKATDGQKTMTTVLTVPRVKRLFFPLAQTYLAKQIDYLLR